MAFFPIFIQPGPCLVVGGGKVAARKAEQLLDFGGEVTVVAKEAGPALLSLAAAPGAGKQLQLKIRPFKPEDVSGMTLVIAATDDSDCNRAVAACCRAGHIPVNVADVPELCDFYFPALVKRGDLVVGISTGGKSPAFARKVREKLEELLPEELGEKLSQAGRLRELLLAKGLAPAEDEEYEKAVTIE